MPESLSTLIFRGGLLKGLSVAVAFSLSVILARLLGVEGVGLYSFAFTLISKMFLKQKLKALYADDSSIVNH